MEQTTSYVTPPPTNHTGNSTSGQTIIITERQQQSNGLGVAGFVCALLAIFLGWVPVIGWILWALGAIFSFIGVFKTPRGLSIAGLAISFIGLIFLILLAGFLATLFALS